MVDVGLRTMTRGRLLRRVVVVGALLLACCLGGVSCASLATGSPDVELLSTSDWVTITGDGVSLKLPDTFVGGDPNDSEVAAMLQELGLVWVSPEEVFSSEPMRALGQVDASGDRPSVRVDTFSVDSYTPFKLFAATIFDLTFDDFRIERLESDSAYLVGEMRVLGFRYSGGGVIQHVAVREAEEAGERYTYVISYECAKELAEQYDALFRTSAETIVIGPTAE